MLLTFHVLVSSQWPGLEYPSPRHAPDELIHHLENLHPGPYRQQHRASHQQGDDQVPISGEMRFTIEGSALDWCSGSKEHSIASQWQRVLELFSGDRA